jgi:hypothetical protein
MKKSSLLLLSIFAAAAACDAPAGSKQETESLQPTADAGSEAGEDAEPEPEGPPEPKCSEYCDAVMNACKGQFGAPGSQAQYPNQATCEKYCYYLGNGAYEDQKGDTVGCRLNAAKAGNCAAAGATGGNLCVDELDPPDGGSLAQAQKCRGFCYRATQHCIKENGVDPMPFKDMEDCETRCGRDFKLNESGPELAENGNTLNCRLYHLILSMENGADQSAVYHCPHLGYPATAFCR